MASWLSRVSGGLWESPSTSPSVADLPPDSYEGQLRKQQRHLTSRQCFQVFINVLGARNVPEVSRRRGFYVTLEGMMNCGGFKLQTPTVDKVEDLRWPGEDRMLHFESSTTGFCLELTCARNVLRDKSLGRGSFLFQDLLQQPELSVEAWYSLMGPEGSSPELLVKARIRPAVFSPYLLRAVKGDFQKDNLETIVPNKRQKPNGRWSTRSILDHNSEEKYLIRVRRAKVKRRYRMEWNSPVEEWEKEVCIYQQRFIFDEFNRKKLSVQADSVAGLAQHRIGTQSFKKSGHVQRQWSLFASDDIIFEVQRDDSNIQWKQDLHFELIGKGFGYPVELRTGRHLQYEVSKAEDKVIDYESGYVTVIRKTPDCPAGKATALFNWKAIAMEVTPEENVTMVMLMAVVTALVVQGWYEEETTDTKARETKKQEITNSRADKKGIWGAVSMDSNNRLALSVLLRKFKESSYSRVDAKRCCKELNQIPQPEWHPEMFELLHDIFGGGCKIDDVPGFGGVRKSGGVAGFEGGYIDPTTSALGFLGDFVGLVDGGGGGGGGGQCGGGGCGGGGDGGGGGGGCGGGGGGGGGP